MVDWRRISRAAPAARLLHLLRRQAKPVLWLAAGLALGLAGPQVFRSPGVSEPADGEYAVAARAIDGDTIELATGERVRYVGIDTPELYRRSGTAWVYHPEPYAEQAWTFNRLAVEGRTVRLEFDIERRDRYQRRLAYVYRDDRFINADLIAQGLADVMTIPPNTRHTELFRRLEREARDTRRGVWAERGAP